MTNPQDATPSDGGGGRRSASGRWAAAELKRVAERAGRWSSIRDSIDLTDVARRLMGEPPGRRGERGQRLWWRCPFHPDNNPSFCIEPGRLHWRCFGCNEHGDALDLVKKYLRMEFREAVQFLTSDARPGAVARPESPPKPAPKPAGDDSRSMLRRPGAIELVEGSADRLWTPEGHAALESLRGRGLNDQTIRLARLGWTPALFPRSSYRGITIPWLGPDGLELLKLRQPDGREPRYAEVYRRRPRTYPGPPLAILPDLRALVVVEGELDALLLGQELAGLATVITMGPASSRPDEETLRLAECAYRLFLSTDADPAGEAAAAAWPKKGKRVRPPEPHKDWTEAHQAGIKLRPWWIAHLMADPEDVEGRAPIREPDGGLSRAEAAEPAGLGQSEWSFARAADEVGPNRLRSPDFYPKSPAYESLAI